MRFRRLRIASGTAVLVAGLLTPTVTAATDTDRDGLPNTWERASSLTNPSRADTDRDGTKDGLEDQDRDGLTNRQEYLAGMHPRRVDTDRDGVRDGREDTDGDTLRTAFEFLAGTSPRRVDSDSDGTRDGRENPDKDGLNNLYEQRLGTKPRLADTDGDGWSDGVEWRAGTNPRSRSSHPPGTGATPSPTPQPTPGPTPGGPTSPPTAGLTVPGSIDATCGSDVSGALNAWIAGQPDGSTLVFPSGSCYRLGGDAGLNLARRTGLTLIGTGSTIQLRTTGASNFSSAFLLQDSDDIIVSGFTVDGGNQATGTTGAAAAIDEHINGAIIRAGSDNVLFDGVNWDRVYGFGVFINDAGRPGDWPEDVTIRNSTIRGGEMGIAITAGRRINIVNNTIADSVYIAIDLEPDQTQHGFENVLVQGNTVSRYSWGQNLTSWFVAANPADSVVGSVVMNGLTVTGNHVDVGAATQNNGNADGLGGLGIRADKDNLKRDVTITNNTTSHHDTQASKLSVMYLANVENLIITGNHQPIANGASLVSDTNTTGTRSISGNKTDP